LKAVFDRIGHAGVFAERVTHRALTCATHHA